MDAEDINQLIEVRGEVKSLIKAIETLTSKFDKLNTIFASIENVSALTARVGLLEKILFGAIAVSLVSVIGAVIALILKK